MKYRALARCALIPCLWLFCVGLIFLVPAGSQPMADRATLRGKVTDVDGKPLGGASVMLRRGTDAGSAGYWGGVTYTDARGEFVFEGAEEGSYYVSVEAGGYAPVQNRPQAVKANAPPAVYSLKLLGNLSLRVLAPDGSPLASMPLPAALHSPETGTYNQSFTQLNEKGEAVINGIVPGVYQLSTVVAARGYGSIPQIDVKSGPNGPIDITLHEGGTLRLVARQEAGDGSRRTAGGVVVSFAPQGQGSGPGARPLDWMYVSTEQGRTSRLTRDGDGATEFQNVPPGLYELTLTPGASGEVQKLRAEVKAGEVAEVEMILKPAPAGQVTVLVKNSDDSPAADTEFIVMAQQLGTPDPASIVPAGGTPPARTEQVINQLERRARTDAEGRFTIFPLQPGRWRLRVQSGRGPGQHQAVTTPAWDLADGSQESAEVKLPEKKEG